MLVKVYFHFGLTRTYIINTLFDLQTRLDEEMFTLDNVSKIEIMG